MRLAELTGSITVVADEHGTIIATVLHTTRASNEAPTSFEIQPGPGQRVQTLRIPAELDQLVVAERVEQLHRGYRLHHDGTLRRRAQQTPRRQ